MYKTIQNDNTGVIHVAYGGNHPITHCGAVNSYSKNIYVQRYTTRALRNKAVTCKNCLSMLSLWRPEKAKRIIIMPSKIVVETVKMVWNNDSEVTHAIAKDYAVTRCGLWYNIDGYHKKKYSEHLHVPGTEPTCKSCRIILGLDTKKVFKLPETPKVAVDCIVEYHRKLVVIKRKFPPLGYAWPGGFVDVGETCPQAVVREMQEEINLMVKPIDLIGVFSKPDRDPRGHVVSLVYIGEAYGGTLKAKDDAKKVHLLSLDEVLKLNMVIDHKEMLMAALDHPKFDKRHI